MTRGEMFDAGRGSAPPPLPPPLPPQSLDYGGARSATSRAASIVLLFSPWAFALTLAMMFVLLAIFVFVVPRLTTVYTDFGTPLPLVTTLMIAVGRFMQTPLGWLCGVAVAFGVAAVASFAPIRGRWLRLALVVLFALLILGLALAVLLPMLNLMESISKNPGKM